MKLRLPFRLNTFWRLGSPGSFYGEGLCHMRPALSLDDLIYAGMVHSEYLSKDCPRNAGLIKLPNLLNAIFSELGAGMFFTTKHAFWMHLHTSLSFVASILHILLVRCSPKVSWITTRGIVAVVTNKKAFWDWAYSELIGKAMGVMMLVSADVKMTISFADSTALPFPTWPEFRSVCWNRPVLINTRPKMGSELRGIDARMGLHVQPPNQVGCAAPRDVSASPGLCVV